MKSWPSGTTVGPASPASRTGCTSPIPRRPADERRGPGALRGLRRALCRRALPHGGPLRRAAGPPRAVRIRGANFTTTECFRDVSGRDVLRATTENGLEGVVAKRRNSTYRPGRRVAEWVKVKVVNTQEVVIGGWTDGEGRPWGQPGLPAARNPRVADGLDYVGKVGTGFDERALQSIMEQLRALRSRTNPFTGTITDSRGQRCALRASRAWSARWGTANGPRRSPAPPGLARPAPDKTPADVGRESEPSTSAPDEDLAPMRTRTPGPGPRTARSACVWAIASFR